MYHTVLITGAGGFIGAHLVERQLALGRHVRALDLDVSRLARVSDAALERIEGDFTDPAIQEQAVRGVDLVFHLASAHLEVKTPPETYWRVNVHALPGFLERCRGAGVERFVHVSSVGVYGEVEQPPANEDSPCRPTLLYERTKYEGELVVKRFYEETGFPIVILRPAWVYGPGCPRTQKLFRGIQKKRFFFVGDGSTRRHCVYVDDFVDALELSANHESAVGRTYVIGDDEPVTLEDLVQEIATVLDVSPPRLHVPVWLMRGLGLLMELAFYPLHREPPVSRRTVRFFTGNTAFDTFRARNELGFAPQYTLARGLRAYAEWLGAGASASGQGRQGASGPGRATSEEQPHG